MWLFVRKCICNDRVVDMFIECICNDRVDDMLRKCIYSVIVIVN